MAGTILSKGETLGGYRIEDILGMGGMAIVYQAEQLSLGRQVALKVLAPQLSGDAAFRERFRREGKHIAGLDHPNVVTVFDSGEIDGRLFMAMRLVNGTTLADRMQGEGVSAEDTMKWLIAVAAALDEAHQLGLVHRDIKPQNILISETNHPYLADFGVAKVAGTTAGLTSTGAFVGSINYAAPEQILGEDLTPAGDIYALTAVLYQCLTGQVPFPRATDAGVMHAHLHDPPPQLPPLGPAASGLDPIIAKGLAKIAADRYEHASELTSDASKALDLLPDSQRRQRPAFRLHPNVESFVSDLTAARAPSPGTIDGTTFVSPQAPERVPRVDANADSTEILGAHAARRGELTTADVRHPAPEPVTTPMPAAERSTAVFRGRIVAGVGVLGAVIAGAAVVVLASGGGTQSPIVRTASAGPLALRFKAPWTSAGRASPYGPAFQNSPIALKGHETMLTAGSLAESALAPAGLPPYLARTLKSPQSTSATAVDGHQATLYQWTSPGHQVDAFVVGAPAADLALICSQTTRSATATLSQCTSLVGKTVISGVSVLAPGQPGVNDVGLRATIAKAGRARDSEGGLRTTTLQARADGAKLIARSDRRAAARLSTATLLPRERPDATALASALRKEASAYAALAAASSADSRTRYSKAARKIELASKSVAADSATFAPAGLGLASLKAVVIPAAPKPPAPPPVSTTPAVSQTYYTPPASTSTPASKPATSKPVTSKPTTSKPPTTKNTSAPSCLFCSTKKK